MPPALAGTLAVLRLLPRVSRPLTVGLAAGIVAQTALPLAFLVLTGQLVGSIPAAVRGGIDSSAGHTALLLLAGAAIVTALQRIVTSVAFSQASVFGRRVDRYLQERVIAAVSHPSEISHLEDPAVLNLIETAQGVGTQDTKPGLAVMALSSLLPSWFQALGSAVILITFRWWLGVSWLLLWPVVLYYLQREYVRVGKAASGEAAAVRRSDYLRDLALTPPAAKEVRIWGLPDWLIDRYEASWLQAMAPIWRARRPGRAVLWISTAVVAAANLLAFGVLAGAAVYDHLALASLAVYVQAIVAANGFRAFDDQNMDLAYAAVAVPALFELESEVASHKSQVASLGTQDSKHKHSDPEGILQDSKLVTNNERRTANNDLAFHHVSFRYPGNSVDTLAGVDLEIPAGKSLAIVGANGAGKTTMVKLLCRLYEPTSGRITAGGVDLASIDPAAWHRQIAAIFQDFTRYHLSARDNIALGAPELAGAEDRIRAAAARAGALELIEALPQGWDTVLSRQYAGGADLSGGQWQRIALARALFAVEAGARVLVLDEPTANLDVRAEAELYDRFLELTAGLTTILISHRFSTVRRADHIVVLERGQIVERGNHDQLVALGGGYADMFRLQAERFIQEEQPVG